MNNKCCTGYRYTYTTVFAISKLKSGYISIRPLHLFALMGFYSPVASQFDEVLLLYAPALLMRLVADVGHSSYCTSTVLVTLCKSETYEYSYGLYNSVEPSTLRGRHGGVSTDRYRTSGNRTQIIVSRRPKGRLSGSEQTAPKQRVAHTV